MGILMNLESLETQLFGHRDLVLMIPVMESQPNLLLDVPMVKLVPSLVVSMIEVTKQGLVIVEYGVLIAQVAILAPEQIPMNVK